MAARNFYQDALCFNCEFFNLVPRVSSLLFLYSGIQEAVRQSDWLFAILGRNSDLRGVNDLGMSKFNLTSYSLPTGCPKKNATDLINFSDEEIH